MIPRHVATRALHQYLSKLSSKLRASGGGFGALQIPCAANVCVHFPGGIIASE